MEPGNLYRHIPNPLPEEISETLVSGKGIKIERILSHGQCSEPGFWYDQPNNEWILLMQGEATLRFAQPERLVRLSPGMYLNIRAHEKHRVESTAEDKPTIWLAVFYSN